MHTHFKLVLKDGTIDGAVFNQNGLCDKMRHQLEGEGYDIVPVSELEFDEITKELMEE